MDGQRPKTQQTGISMNNVTLTPYQPQRVHIHATQTVQDLISFISNKQNNESQFKRATLNERNLQNYYRFLVVGGNNAKLVRKVLNRRIGWRESATPAFAQVHFQWSDVSQRVKFDRIKSNTLQRQAVNHFEGHKELSSKTRLLRNLSSICRREQIYLHDIVPITFLVDYQSENFDSDFEDFLSFFMRSSCSQQTDTIAAEILRRKNYYRQFGERESKIALQGQNMTSNHERAARHTGFLQLKTPQTMFKGHNIWLFKPSDQNRGRGIKVFNNLQTLNSILAENADISNSLAERFSQVYKYQIFEVQQNSHKKNASLRHNLAKGGRKFVLQKYIEAPMLFHGRKFDIRVWALVTHDLRFYVFKDGYIRTASETFDISDQRLSNSIVHLTNNAVQIHSDKYGQLESGNQVSYDQFQRYLNEKRFL